MIMNPSLRALPIFFICFILQNCTYAQNTTAKKFYVKYIRLIDTDTKQPIPGYFYTIMATQTSASSGQTDNEGYGRADILEHLYSKKAEVNLNDGAYFDPEWIEWQDKINKVPYELVNKDITFPSPRNVIDTVIVELKRLPDSISTIRYSYKTEGNKRVRIKHF